MFSNSGDDAYNLHGQVGHHEPQLIRVDIDENAVSTIKGLMQYYKLNITLAAIRHTHPFLEHAKDRLVLCENPCHGGASLSRFLGEQERSKTNTDSCPVPDICMCSGLDPPAQVCGEYTRHIQAANKIQTLLLCSNFLKDF